MSRDAVPVTIRERPPPPKAGKKAEKFARAVSRISLLATDGFSDEVQAAGGDPARMLPCLMYVARSCTASKHIPKEEERECAFNIVTDLCLRCGQVLADEARALARAVIDDVADAIRAAPKAWKARG